MSQEFAKTAYINFKIQMSEISKNSLHARIQEPKDPFPKKIGPLK